MRRVYIAHPVRGDIIANLNHAKSWVRWAASEMEVCPLAPYLYLQEIMNGSEKELQHLLLEHLKFVDELWVCGTKITEGMQIEIDYAQRWMLPIKYFETQRQRHKKDHKKCVHGVLLAAYCSKCGVVEEDIAP